MSPQMLPLKANIAMQLQAYCSTREGSIELAQSSQKNLLLGPCPEKGTEAWQLRAWSGVQRSELPLAPVPGTPVCTFCLAGAIAWPSPELNSSESL